MKLGKNRVNLGIIETCKRQRCACSKKEVPHYKDESKPNGCTNSLCRGFDRIIGVVIRLELDINQFVLV